MTQSAINIESLLSTLRNNLGLPVVFSLNEQTISQGYHISEVKHAIVDSLDCAQGATQWSELIIQLLDGNAQSTSGYMLATKMLAILEQVAKKNPLTENSKLYFEFSPGNTALTKSIGASIEIIHNTIVVSLTNSPAQCKPFQRSLKKAKSSEQKTDCCSSDLAAKPIQPYYSADTAQTSCCS